MGDTLTYQSGSAEYEAGFELGKPFLEKLSFAQWGEACEAYDEREHSKECPAPAAAGGGDDPDNDAPSSSGGDDPDPIFCYEIMPVDVVNGVVIYDAVPVPCG